MKKEKFLESMLGTMMLVLSAYAGRHTYDVFANEVNESDLLLADVETLANNDGEVWNPFCCNGGLGSSSCPISAGFDH